jgi:hypothetical protein
MQFYISQTCRSPLVRPLLRSELTLPAKVIISPLHHVSVDLCATLKIEQAKFTECLYINAHQEIGTKPLGIAQVVPTIKQKNQPDSLTKNC